MLSEIKLTQFSHGTGCDCKIALNILETILYSERKKFNDPHLLVGNETNDNSVIYDLGNGVGIN